MKNTFIFLCFLLGIQPAFTQEDTILLKEATLSDAYLLRFSETQKTIYISDSAMDRNPYTLTSLLNLNSGIYFKENGAGMVSSPSFRGTSAQHTILVWNGIGINSQFNGQTDFNTINTRGFDNIAFKLGGVSVAYGSNAIGGSVHLNNDLDFRKGFTNHIQMNYGSFDSYGFDFKSKFSDENLSINIGFARNGSDNDYQYVGKDQKNLNGQYYNNNLSIAAGYRFNKQNLLKFYGNLADSDKHFSLATPNAIRTRYHDYNTRSLIEWDGFYGKFISKLRLAHLGEKYRYFPTLNAESFEFGEADTWIAKYDLVYRWNNNIFFNTVIDYTQSEGQGSAYDAATRRTGSASILMKHKLNAKLLYELSFRFEATDDFESPFLYSFGLKYEAAKFYTLTLNTSKNFRVPTFNDMYWPGNQDVELKPEISYQGEIGNLFHFKEFNFSLGVYYNSLQDMIRWIPSQGSLWNPENTNKVRIYGLESDVNYQRSFGKHRFELNGNYAYTVSQNAETDKQLMYVPFHKATASLGYSWKKFSLYYQFLYNGKVFIDPENKKELAAYELSNMGIEWSLGKKNSYKIGFQIFNILNENYQSVLNRYMPGRNFNLYVNLKL